MNLKRVFCVALLVVAGSLFAGTDASLRKEIDAVYARWDRAAMAKDTKTLLAMLHPDYVMIDKDGKRTGGKEFKQMMDSMMPICKDLWSKITVEKVDGYGNEATVWNSFSMKFKMKQGKKWVPMAFTERTVETLRKGPKGWQFVQSVALP